MHTNTMTTHDILQQYRQKIGTTVKTDFKDPATLALARTIASELIRAAADFQELVALEKQTTASDLKSSLPNLLHLAVKLARSRASVLGSRPFHASIILPAYGENIRMKERGTGPGQHPNGENFIIEKSKQLQWLFAGSPSTYEVTIVDDMSKPDPETSGQAAADVIAKADTPHFQVLFLEDGVRNEKRGDAIVARALIGVEHPKNTKKAGAVYYGIAKAIEKHGTADSHVIVLTDCDLSVDIGQLGNLANPILNAAAMAAAGSRRLPESILEIEAARNLRANTARYFRELLLKGLLPKDTQCGAKAFAAAALNEVISSGMQILDFSFDIELLTKIALQFSPGKVVPVAVAWFDSAELTTTDSSVHFNIMKAQLAIAKSNHTGSGPVFDEAVAVSEHLTSDESVWLKLLDNLKDQPTIIERVQSFDPAALSELKALSV
ncbi:MAG TPA: hypothetical protein VG941_01580 [Candidatus Paceibacterota bacterium]|nr:hypothetical protein [Candidatus Paceibacterota bacterium]